MQVFYLRRAARAGPCMVSLTPSLRFFSDASTSHPPWAIHARSTAAEGSSGWPEAAAEAAADDGPAVVHAIFSRACLAKAWGGGGLKEG